MRALTLVLLLAACAVPAAADGPPTARGELLSGNWRAGALGHRAEGGFLLLRGHDGALRLEVGDADAAAPEALLARRGRGWTVVAGPDGRGTRNGWDREWTPLEPRLGALLGAGAELLDARPPVPFRRRSVVPDPEASPRWRDRLVRRGGGRGGAGEVLVLAGRPDGALVFTSTRRPGRVRLTGLARRPVAYPAREAFVPLWPLADLVEPAP